MDNPRTLPLPPQPWGLPLLGNIPQLSRLGPIEYFTRLRRRYGDIFAVNAGPQRMVVIAHPDAVERVLAANAPNYVKGPTYDGMRLLTGNGLLTLEGDEWKRRRRLEQPFFHRAAIERFVETMVSVTARSLDDWRRRLPEGGVLEAHDEMMRLTLEVVGETLFGQQLGGDTTSQSAAAFTDALSQVSARGNAMVQLPLSIPTPGNLRFRRALEVLDTVTAQVIQRARENPDPSRPTLLSMLIAARDADTGEALTDRDVRNEVITLFLAGHETTALLLTWGFTLLGRHPEVVARMREEVDQVLGGRLPAAADAQRLPYVRMVIDEILRVRSPVWTVARDVVGEDVLTGFRVKKGDVVMPMSYLTHRHPDFWEDPERFDPLRFEPAKVKERHKWAYYPFSLGARMCIGNVFSLVEATVVLAMLLQRADFELTSTDEVPMDPAVTLRPGAPVHLRLKWRATA